MQLSSQPVAATANRLPSLIAVAALVLSALIFLTQAAAIWNFTIDDAFITFRYARNLAAGAGPTYNPGAPPVEGYTTFLWMALMALPHLLGLDAVQFSRVVGVGAVLATMAVCYHFVLRLTGSETSGERRLIAAVPAVLLGMTPLTAIHAVSGMETTLFTLFATLFLYLLYHLLDEPTPRRASLVAFAALLTGLTRPEGNLIAAVGLASALPILPRSHRWLLMRSVLLAYVLPGAAYFIWRLLYYDLLLPLPYYLKVAGTIPFAGRWDVATFSLYVLTYTGIPVLLSVNRLDSRLIPPLLPGLALLAFYLWPEHIMGFGWRYLYPAVPLAFTGAAVGLGVLSGWMSQIESSRRLLLLFGVLMLMGVAMLAETPPRLPGWAEYGRGMDRAHILLGRKLAEFASPEGTPVLAISDAGATPYYSGWTTVDTYGLNNRTIALSGDHDPADVLAQNPAVVVVFSHRPGELDPPLGWERDLYAASVAAGMARIKVIRVYQTYYMWVLAYENSPVGRYLSAWQPESEVTPSR